MFTSDVQKFGRLAKEIGAFGSVSPTSKVLLFAPKSARDFAAFVL
jgi:hypothetical protein